MKNRRESRNIQALANHNYLKKVYEGAKPLFAVVRNEAKLKCKALRRKKRINVWKLFKYIERYAAVGQCNLWKICLSLLFGKPGKRNRRKAMLRKNLITKIHIGKSH
ncbi:hypothetical protein MZA98_09650 [Haemophilus influenzae]